MEAVHEITHYYSTHCTRRTKHCHGSCSPAFSEHTLPHPSPSPHHVLAERQHRCEHQQKGADDGHEEATGEGGGHRNPGWVKIPFLVQSLLKVVNLARGRERNQRWRKSTLQHTKCSQRPFVQTASNPPCHPILPNPLVQLPVHTAHLHMGKEKQCLAAIAMFTASLASHSTNGCLLAEPFVASCAERM